MTETTQADGMPTGSGPDGTVPKKPGRLGRRKMILGVATAGVGASVVAGAEPASAGDGNALLVGKTNSAKATTIIKTTYGDGLMGTTTQNGQNGLEGIDDSPGGGQGVRGVSDYNVGVYGLSKVGTGVYGTGAFGIYGSSAETGVYGGSSGSGGYGVQGYASGEEGIAVYAQAYGSATQALYAEGNAEVTGTLSKGGGSFKIDHPADPENKYLYHSFVESPDMKNVYDGTVTLDSDGRATVELPDWFEALNRDYRYQLTAIGSSAPELHISREVQNGAFSIAGGKRGQKVSWQVTGIRQDAWANANRIPVDVDKKAEDRGRYLHPELFGGEAITAIAKARQRGRMGGGRATEM
jgi:hypothetical protein